MCIYSLSIDAKMTKAKVGETLIVGEYKHHRLLMDESGEPRCVSPGSELQIAKLQFDQRFVDAAQVHQPDGQMIRTQRMLKWQGKSVTVRLTRWTDNFGRTASDAFTLPNGVTVPFGWLVKGVRMERVRKVRKDAGIKRPRNLDKVLGLDQIRADLPKDENVVAVREHLRRRTVAVKG